MPVPIKDGRMHFGASLAGIAAHPKSHMGRMSRRDGFRIPPLTEVDPGSPLVARVYRGQWIVDCPDCKGAEFVWPDEQVMMCCCCWNQAVGGKWRKLKLPGNKAVIERILLARPLAVNRNWFPGETSAKLKKENRDYGLPEEAV